MPKLPQLEYNVNVQGPPNVAQAFNAVAGALQTMQDIQNDSMMEIAKEQAKAQTSTASAIVQSGLGALENKLAATPYFKPQEVIDSFGEQPIPRHVQEAIDLAGENGSVPTMVFGAALHQAAAKQLAAEAGKEIWSKGVRTDFEQRAVAETIQRNVRLDHTLSQEWAKTEAVKAEVVLESQARAAMDPASWRKVYAGLETNPHISPERKEVLTGEFNKLQFTQGQKYEAMTVADAAFDAGVASGSRVLDENKVFASLDAATVGKPPGVRSDARAFLKQRIEAFNEQRKATTNSVAAQAIQEFLAPGPNGKPRLNTAFLSPEVKAYLANPANGLEAAEVNDRLRKEQESAEMRDRQIRQLPTDAQAAALLALEDDIRRNPGKYRNMTPAQLNDFAVSNFKNLPIAYSNRVNELVGQIRTPQAPVDVLGAQAQVQKRLIEAGLLPRPGTKQKTTVDQVSATNLLTDDMGKWLTSEKNRTGTIPDEQKRGEWIDSQLRDVEVRKRWLTIPVINVGLVDVQTKHAIEARVAGEKPTYESSKPDLLRALQAQGIDSPTEEQLRATYDAWTPKKRKK